MNLDLYEEEIFHEGWSVFTGGETISGKMHYTEMSKAPLMQAFLDDDDIQEIRIVSANIGFGRTFRKVYKKK